MYLKMLGGVVLILSTSLIGSIKAGELKERVENVQKERRKTHTKPKETTDLNFFIKIKSFKWLC